MRASMFLANGLLLVTACMTGCADRKLMQESIAAAQARAVAKQEALASLHMEHPGYRDLYLALLFDGSAADYNLTQCKVERDNVTPIEQGRFGGGVRFRGASTITIPIMPIPDEGTLAFWFRIDHDPNLSDEIRLLDGNGICVMISAGKLRSIFNDSETLRRLICPERPTRNRWIHVALTWGEMRQVIYVDGNVSGTGSYSGQPRFAARNMVIGARWTGKECHFSGDMDEICFYERTLSDAEVFALFREGVNHKGTE